MGVRIFNRTLKAIGTADPERDISPLIETAIAAIRRMRHGNHATRGGAYLLADKSGSIYVIAENASTTPAILNRDLALVVGLYYSSNRPCPTPEQLRADLIQHFIDIGLVTEPMIYESVRFVEG